MTDDSKTPLDTEKTDFVTPDSSQRLESAEDAIEYPTGIKLAVIITALCLAVFLVALDQTIIATAIPKITDRFKSVQDIGWYGSVCSTFRLPCCQLLDDLEKGVLPHDHIASAQLRKDL